MKAIVFDTSAIYASHFLENELGILKAIKDNYPKLLLTLDDDPEGDYEGIIRKNALDWLMGK